MSRVSRRTFVKLAGASTAAMAIGGHGLVATQDVSAQGLSTITSAPSAQMVALDPQMQAVIDELIALEAPKLTDMNPFNARQGSALGQAVMAVVAKQGKPAQEQVVNVAHRLIPGGAGQQMLVRIYQPDGPGPFPTLVYYHGGGWVISNLDGYDSSCRALVNAANCMVVSVAYRQAPEYKFPAAPMDAFAAYQWVIKNAASIRTDPTKVAVGGESAGGNLATVTAMMARDMKAQMPVHQLLVYPVTDYLSNNESQRMFTDAMPLNTPMLSYFYTFYLRSAADRRNPYFAPLQGNIIGLPPATVITAEVDPLRDEGEAYAMKLKNGGVPVTLTRYAGVTHEFFSMAGVIDKAKMAVMEAATALKQAFGTA